MSTVSDIIDSKNKEIRMLRKRLARSRLSSFLLLDYIVAGFAVLSILFSSIIIAIVAVIGLLAATCFAAWEAFKLFWRT